MRDVGRCRFGGVALAAQLELHALLRRLARVRARVRARARARVLGLGLGLG